jgi:hypothetical protein
VIPARLVPIVAVPDSLSSQHRSIASLDEEAALEEALDTVEAGSIQLQQKFDVRYVPGAIGKVDSARRGTLDRLLSQRMRRDKFETRFLRSGQSTARQLRCTACKACLMLTACCAARTALCVCEQRSKGMQPWLLLFTLLPGLPGCWRRGTELIVNVCWCCCCSESLLNRGSRLNVLLAQRPTKEKLEQINVIKTGVSCGISIDTPHSAIAAAWPTTVSCHLL